MIESAKQQPTTIGEFAILLLTPKTSDEYQSSRALMSYVRRLIKQYNLKNIEAEEVLNEVFLRALKKYNNEFIEFPSALIRSFCLNVVREMKRKQQKYVTSEDYFLETTNSQEDSPFAEEIDFQKIEKLEHLLSSLSPLDKEIIGLWAENYSDREISQRLTKNEKQMPSENIKKRRQRLISRLRKGANT